MTDLTRERVNGKTAAGNPETRWQVVGPHGAIALHSVAGHYAGLAAHRRNTGGPDVDSCEVLGGKPCEVDALGDRLGRELHAIRDDEGAVFAALVREYAREWPGGGRCGESVPQADYDTPKVLGTGDEPADEAIVPAAAEAAAVDLMAALKASLKRDHADDIAPNAGSAS